MAQRLTNISNTRQYLKTQVPGHVAGGRPTGNLAPGYLYFDTDLQQPVWWNGSAWVLAGTSGLTSSLTLTPNDLLSLGNNAGSAYVTLVSAAGLQAHQAIVWQSIEFMCDLTGGTPYTTTANLYIDIGGNYSGGQRFPVGDTVANGNLGLLTATGRVDRRFVYNLTPDMQINTQDDLNLKADGPITGGTQDLKVRVTYQIVDLLT